MSSTPAIQKAVTEATASSIGAATGETDLAGATPELQAPEVQAPEVQAPEVQAIDAFKPFASLPPAVKTAIEKISETRRYEAGETIYALGQYDGAEFFVVTTGGMKVSRMDAKTGSMHVNVYAAGQAFGLAAAVAGHDNGDAGEMTLVAESDAAIILIDAAGFRDLVGQRPSLTKNLMQHFAAKLAQGGEHVAEEEMSPERRVYAALMEMTERDPVSGDFRILKMPKHREIAERAGVEEPFAAQAIAQIIQDGVAKRDYPGMVICDIAEFNRLAS